MGKDDRALVIVAMAICPFYTDDIQLKCPPWEGNSARSSARFWKEISATSGGPSRVAHVAATSNFGRSVIP